MNELKRLMNEMTTMVKTSFIESEGLPNEDEIKMLKLALGAAHQIKILCDDIEQLKLEVKQLKDEKES